MNTRFPLIAVCLLGLLAALWAAPVFCQAQKPELVVQSGHTSDVTCIAFSRDGKTLASGSRDKTIKLWDAATGQLLHTITGHTGFVDCVTFSPDGKTLASGSEDNTIKLWDTATGQELHTLTGHTDSVRSVSFSPDGKTLASGSYDNTVKVWDAATGQLLRTLTGHTFYVECVTFSPDGKTLASGSLDKTIKLWDTATGRELRTLTGHADSVQSVAFSPDGKTLASGSSDKTIKLWDAATGQELHTLTGHTEEITSLAFSSDGKTLASGSRDNTLKSWDTATGQLLHTLTGYIGEISPDGKTFAGVSGNYNTIRLWDIATGQPLYTLTGRVPVGTFVAFSPDGKTLASGSGLGAKNIRLWDTVTGQLLHTLIGHTDSVRSVAFSPGGKTLASGSMDKTIKLWDTATGHLLQTLTDKTSIMVLSVRFSPDGKTLASSSMDNTVKLWDVATGQLRQILSQPPMSYVTSVVFSPNGKTIAVSTGSLNLGTLGKMDNTVNLWDAATGKLLRAFGGNTRAVMSVSFSPDGKTLAGGSYDKTIKLWNIAAGQELYTLTGHADSVMSVAFSPDGKTLASGSMDKTIKLWDTTTGRELHALTGHTDPVWSVAFSPNGKTLASGSYDNTLKFWDTTTGKEMASLYSLGENDWAVVTPAGRFDASPGGMTQMHFVVGLEPIDLSQLKDRYYEPGLLAKLLGYNKEPLRDVSAFDHVDLTPEVKAPAAVPADGKLPLTLTNRGGGIGRVQVFVNGKELLADARGPKPDPNAKTAMLTVDVSHAPGLIPGQPNTVRIVTWNAEGYLSSRGTEEVYTPPSRAALAPPDLWAIVGGISDYAGPGLRLTYPAKDAADFAHALTLAAKNLFGADKVHLTLLDTGGQPGAITPTKANLQKAFEAARQAKPGDVFVVYLAGHGVALPGEHDLYCYLAQNATTGNPATLSADLQLRQATTVSSEELTEWIKQVPAQKQVMVLDTCAAGAAAGLLTAKRDIPSDQIRAIERLKDRTGFYVLLGCAADAVSYETSQYRQGLLTYSLLKGMKGAKLRDGQYVDVSDLFSYAVDEVPQLAQNIGGVQRPFVAAPAAGSFDVGRLSETDRADINLATAVPLLLRPELVALDDDLNLEEMLITRLRDESAKPRGDGDAPAPSFVDATGFPGAIQPRGTYTVTGKVVSVTLKLRQNSSVLKTLTVTGSRDDLRGLVTKLATAITGAIGTP